MRGNGVERREGGKRKGEKREGEGRKMLHFTITSELKLKAINPETVNKEGLAISQR